MYIVQLLLCDKQIWKEKLYFLMMWTKINLKLPVKHAVTKHTQYMYTDTWHINLRQN